MMTKIFYLYDKFFDLNQNYTTEHVKIVKIPGFFNDFCSKFQVFFCLNCQIPSFSRITGKVATLFLCKTISINNKTKKMTKIIF